MKKKILIIDDEMYIRKILEHNLLESGFEVDLAEDTYDAEDLVEEGINYDLIITDIMIPIRSGLEFIEILREDYELSDQKILLISARTYSEDQEKAQKFNIDGFLSKPFKIEEIMKKINEILEK